MALYYVHCRRLFHVNHVRWLLPPRRWWSESDGTAWFTFIPVVRQPERVWYITPQNIAHFLILEDRVSGGEGMPSEHIL